MKTVSLTLVPKKWPEFQHYKDRCPPWIKLHRDLLNNRDFMCLPLASKALAPLLWLLASESKDGTFDADHAELAFRLRLTEQEVDSGLTPLISKGFFIDASKTLAPRKQVAIPETETETETETEKSKPVADDGFVKFWSIYPKKVAKAKALTSWKAAKINADDLADILNDVDVKCESDQWKKSGGQFIPNPVTYLNQRRWEDEVTVASGTVSGLLPGAI